MSKKVKLGDMADLAEETVDETVGEVVEELSPEVVEEDKPITREDSKKMEAVFFEDDAEVTLRDGRTYKIPPAPLKNARRIVELLDIVTTEFVLANYLDRGDGTEAADGLIEVLLMAFEGYDHVDEDYINRYVDLVLASEIIDIILGLNGLKKSLGN